MQHNIEEQKEKKDFKNEVRQMVNLVDDVPKKFNHLFEKNRKLPGWSPVRAMIDGELELAIFQSEKRIQQSEEDKQSAQKKIESLNRKHNSNWKPRDVKEPQDDHQSIHKTLKSN